MSLLTNKPNRSEAAPVAQARMSPAELAVFQRLLYEKSGIVLKDNKRALVEARVNQRLRSLGKTSFSSYLDLLKRDETGEELVLLIDVISTNVTQFFREPDHFELMAAVVAQWAKAGRKRLRFWSAACSTGEEPYTMAMTLQPLVARYGLDLKILATDISTRVLAHAKQGRYDPSRLGGVSADLRAKYFTTDQHQGREFCEASEGLKELIMFRRLNFTVFPYPIKGIFDMILCRNAMIYFDRHLRARMVPEFTRLIRPGGYLMIGHSETLIGLEGGLQIVKPSVYQRLNDGETT